MVAGAIEGRLVEFVESGVPRSGRVVSFSCGAQSCVVDAGDGCPVHLDLSTACAKVVYGVGEMHESVAAELVGSYIELESPDGTAVGVLKQHDLDLKCSLVRFDDGTKEWLDLSQRQVRVVLWMGCPRDPSANADAAQVQKEGSASLSLPLDSAPPKTPRTSWYQEGHLIELYDSAGKFREGAVICSYDDHMGSLVVANEDRGKFEIDVTTQPHKLVLHGFNVLKDIPVDHIVEVYSTTKGGFRRGSILKRAESGKLIPVLFENSDSIEWVDLSSQTFKVVCFPKQIRPLSARERQLSDDAARETTQSAQPFNPIQSSERGNINDGSTFRFPTLPEGTQIEVYNCEKSLYVKNTVVRQVQLRPYVYELHASTTGSRSVIDLAATRCKVLLKDSTDLDLRSLVAHVIEVFVKEEKRVDAGRICGCNNKGRMLQVRLQGGRKEWIALGARKLKIRLHEAAIVQPLALTNVRSIDNQTAYDDAPRKTLQRSHSYSIPHIQNPPSPHPVRRSLSSSNMMVVRSPVSQLRRMKSFHNPGDSTHGHPVLARTDSMDSMDGYAIDSARTVESLNESDLGDPQSEWSMQIDPSSNQTYYVHIPTGTSQWHPPPNVDVHALQWIATDSMETHGIEKDVAIHAPIGPIEAVRHIRTTLYNN